MDVGVQVPSCAPTKTKRSENNDKSNTRRNYSAADRNFN